MSMKRPGWELPAQHQIILGGTSLFHAVASVIIRGAEDGSARSALI